MNMRLPFVAALVHLILLHAAVNIYFTSPLVNVTETFSASLTGVPAARRLVLFVADGLRADKCLELDDSGQPRMAFLRSVIEERGAWGLSHGRAPTETRPAHVTIIAGFYEDASGIWKGWKVNPVSFDSVFNKSRHAWCWGSSEILPLFLKGVTDGRVTSRTFGKEVDDFAHYMPSRLDSWVFQDVEDLFKSARADRDLAAALQQEGTIFFLHLLGIDTAGHGYSPISKQYLENVKIVDEGIGKVASLMEDFYRDKQTAYIMTSDHGMTNQGSHGSDRPEETTTPFIAWGAGVRGPAASVEHGEQLASDSVCNQKRPCLGSAGIDLVKWKLSGIKREDIQQADLVPLMASLLGLAFPVNSLGILHTGLLNMSAHDKASSMLANAQQIGAQLRANEELVRQRTLRAAFSPSRRASSDSVGTRLHLAAAAIARGEHAESERLSASLIADALAGIAYYHNYDRPLIWACSILSFTGLVAYALTTVPLEAVEGQWFVRYRLTSRRSAACLALYLVIVILLSAQSSPRSYYLYALAPTCLWGLVLSRRSWDVLGGIAAPSWRIGLPALMSLCVGLHILVASFIRREALSLSLLCLVSMPWWPSSTASSAAAACNSLPRQLRLSWCAACCALAVFPLLPVVSRNDINCSFVVVAACCLSIAIYWEARESSKKTLKFQSALALLAGAVVLWTSINIELNEHSPLFGRIFCWSLLGASLGVPPLAAAPHEPRARLVSLVAALATVYLTLSFSHEGLFILILSYFLVTWYSVESHGRLDSKLPDAAASTRPPSSEDRSHAVERCATFELADFRLAFLFIHALAVAFFGANDLSSMKSLDGTSSRCYTAGYAPLATLCLATMKVALPLLLVSCTFAAILHRRWYDSTQELTRVHSRMSSAVFAMSAFMSLHFFFLIKNEGSWLEIGLSISRYVTTLLLPFVLLFLSTTGRILTSTSLPGRHRSII